ncbi:hypothetical protein HPB52_025045 [Rhipicephalus sanguineus]|uniref:Uncharacterized protein n=1 Tax=Rhipicephalus sanguineus TaxID=34632 RepID=A0A9D4TDJ0_RHISA|nr:hypothetical protein HPB52_025045 [Rhipicephalus sanguineus]
MSSSPPVKMEGRRSSQLWKDEGSVLEAIDELMAPSSEFSLSDIQTSRKQSQQRNTRAPAFLIPSTVKDTTTIAGEAPCQALRGTRILRIFPLSPKRKSPAKADSEEDTEETTDVEQVDDHEDIKMAKQPVIPRKMYQVQVA